MAPAALLQHLLDDLGVQPLLVSKIVADQPWIDIERPSQFAERQLGVTVIRQQRARGCDDRIAPYPGLSRIGAPLGAAAVWFAHSCPRNSIMSIHAFRLRPPIPGTFDCCRCSD